MCLRCRPVGHCVTHNADMGWHPLKVDGESPGGEVVEEVVDNENKTMVGVGTVAEDGLEGCEGVCKEGYGARGLEGVGKIKALFDGKQFCSEYGGSAR